jgi:hypothetical protein
VDVQPFVNRVIRGPQPPACPREAVGDPVADCPYDVDTNCTVDSNDVAAFVCLLVHGAPNCTLGGDGPSGSAGGESLSAAPPDSASGASASESSPSPRDANLREHHPELTDSEHYKLIKRKLRELGLLPE